MVLMKMSYQEDPFAIIFVVVVWPGVAYGIDFYKKCSKRDFSKNVPGPDRSVLKSSRALPEPIWTRISRSRRWDTSRIPTSTSKNAKIYKNPENPGSAAWAKPLNPLSDSPSTALAAAIALVSLFSRGRRHGRSPILLYIYFHLSAAAQ